MPTDVEGWITRLGELMESLDQETVAKAYQGNAEAKALVEVWATEMQAAAIFLASYVEAMKLDVDAMVEMVNTIIDTVQAILIALGILLLLKRLKAKKGSNPLQVTVTLQEYKKTLGNKTNPIPHLKARGKDEEAMYLYLRVEWTTYFLITLFKALELQNGRGGVDLIWKATLDKKTCSICTFMHNKRAINGDFLPVILKQFPTYRAYVNWMGFPHAHPRCRCIAVPA